MLTLSLGLIVAGCSSDNVEELRAKGKKEYEQKEYAQARKYYLKGIELEPADQDLLFNVGLSYRRDLYYDSALFYFKRLDIMYPKDSATNEQIRFLARELGEWRTAIKAVRVLGELSGIGQYYGELAELWGLDQNPRNAFYWGRLAVQFNPDDTMMYLTAARNAQTCDSFDVALNLLHAAVDRFGHSPLVDMNMALVYIDSSDYVAAERLLRPLCEQENVHPGIKQNLAAALAAQNNKKKQMEALEIYKEIRYQLPVNVPVDSMISYLEEQTR